jgi:hypothetical protein
MFFLPAYPIPSRIQSRPPLDAPSLIIPLAILVTFVTLATLVGVV